MKKIKLKKSLLLQNLKPVSGGKAFLVNAKRLNTTETFSFLYYKPISKFEIFDNDKK